jgi:hypothetical protein
MADPPFDAEFTLVLARAFDRAWERYFSSRRVAISEEIARPALATHLVEMARGGILDEGELANGGLLHLISLTPADPDISA